MVSQFHVEREREEIRRGVSVGETEHDEKECGGGARGRWYQDRHKDKRRRKRPDALRRKGGGKGRGIGRGVAGP